MEFKFSEPPITKADLENLEQKIGVELPESFKGFYLANNGGYTTHRFIDDSSIQEFIPIKYGKKTITNTLEKLRWAGIIPEGYLPFAYDPGSWHFCIQLQGENKGAIYLVPLDRPEHFFIAESFEAFISKLSLVDDY